MKIFSKYQPFKLEKKFSTKIAIALSSKTRKVLHRPAQVDPKKVVSRINFRVVAGSYDGFISKFNFLVTTLIITIIV